MDSVLDRSVLHVSRDDSNRHYFLNLLKSIIRTDDGYTLQKMYEETEDENLIVETAESLAHTNKNQYSKSCERCVHCYGDDCTMRTKLENLPEHHFIPYYWVGDCDAYTPIYALTVINSEVEMIDFVQNVEYFFGCPEDYEAYFGFNRQWDMDTGLVLESTKEYYDRGGSFDKLPEKYPCVVYFGLADFENERSRNKKLEWLYLGG